LCDDKAVIEVVALGFRTWDEGRGPLDERDVRLGTEDLNAWTLIGTDDIVTA
jgi:hypothetical protein